MASSSETTTDPTINRNHGDDVDDEENGRKKTVI